MLKINKFSYKLKTVFILPIFLAINFNSNGEGSKQVSPDSNKVASLQLNPNSGIGSGFNAKQEDRIYFKINDHQNENFYFGTKFITPGNLTNLTNVYYKVKNEEGVTLAGPFLLNANISSYSKAVAGPIIGTSNTNGYTPIVFDPTYNGDFYIEIYQSSTPSALTNDIKNSIISPYFDFTVASSTGTIKNGRVYCQKWALLACNRSNNFLGEFTDMINNELFAYTDDQIVVKLKFNNIQSLSFTPAFNNFGVNASETNWLLGRKSIYSGSISPNLANSFKTFLQEPDPLLYPSVSLASPPSISGPITGCPGSYIIPFNSQVNGDIKFVLDLNGEQGYQANSKDRVIELLNTTIGKNIAIWDGLDGLSNLVSQNTIVNTTISMLRGRVNMPLFDAKINKNGVNVSAVRPTAATDLRIFWDDSSLPITSGKGTNLNNTTGPGINNSVNGQVSPGHAWNGPYGTSIITPPALANGGGDATPTLGDDDFGNVRTINTWFWGLEEKSESLSFRIPYCLSVSGKVVNDGNGMIDNQINGNGTNSGNLYAIAIDSLSKVVSNVKVNPDGTFTLNAIDSGKYKIALREGSAAIGDSIVTSSISSNWFFTGEGLTNSGDGTVNGLVNIQLYTSNLTGLLFGVKSLPITYPSSKTVNNPESNLKITLNGLKGLDSLNGNLSVGHKIRIKTLPTNADLYYNNILVIVNQTITNYDSTLLKLDPTFSGAGSIVFNYTFLDVIGKESLNSASITVTILANPIQTTPINNLNNIQLSTITINVLSNVTISGSQPASPSNVYVDLNPNIPGIQDTLIVPNVGTYIYSITTGEVTFQPIGPLIDNPTPITFLIIEKAPSTSIVGNTLNITFILPVKAADDEKYGLTFGQPGDIFILPNDKLSDDSAAVYNKSIVDINLIQTGIQDSLIVTNQGKWKYDSLSGNLSFIPTGSFNGNPSKIWYKLIDKDSGLSDSAQVFMSYIPETPKAKNDSSLLNPYNSITIINILSNDSTSYHTQANYSNVNVDLDLTNIGIQDSLIIQSIGKFKYLSTGEVEFIPILMLSTQPPVINYEIIDKATNLKSKATIKVTYELLMRAKMDSSLNNTPGLNAFINILENDLLSSDSIAIASKVNIDLDFQNSGLQTSLVVANEGVWSYNGISGVVSFDPETGFTKSPYNIKYAVQDKKSMKSDTASIKAMYTLRAPFVKNDSSLLNNTQMAVIKNIISNDSLSDKSPVSPSKITLDLDPIAIGIQHTYLSGNEGIFSYNSTNGQLTFTPKSGFYGNPTPLEYELTENLTSLKAKGTVVITFKYEPKFELIMTTDFNGANKYGDKVKYDLTVINTGNVPITNIFIIDTLITKDTIRLTSNNLLPGGNATAVHSYILTKKDLQKGTFSNSAIVYGITPKSVIIFDVSDNGNPQMLGGSNPTIINFPPVKNIDLALTQTLIGDCKRYSDQFATFNLVLSRQDTITSIVDVIVKDSLGLHMAFISATSSIGTYNSNTGEWTVSLSKGQSATLTIQAKILTNMGGLTSNDAWILSSSILDEDSSPGNKDLSEDDYARSYVSVPMSICVAKEQSADLEIESGKITYQWYKDDVEIIGQTTNMLKVIEAGAFTAKYNGTTCSNSSCCPIYIEDNCACPALVCIPYIITKSK